MGFKPEDCIVFEDSPSGVQAGKASGSYVVTVPDPLMLQYNQVTYNTANMILNSLTDFVPEQFGFPSYVWKK